MAYLSQTVTPVANQDRLTIDVTALPGYSPSKSLFITYLGIQNRAGADQLFILKDGTTRIRSVFTSLKTSGIAADVRIVLKPGNNLFIQSSTAGQYELNIEYTYRA